MPRRVAVWLDPQQVPLVRAVADLAELQIAAAGSGSRGHSQALAAELSATPVDDLRAMLASSDADLVWICAPGPFGAGSGGDDAAAVLEAHSRSVRIATLEPIPASALDLAPGGWIEGDFGLRAIDLVRFIPLLRVSEDVLATFGPVRTLAVESWGAPAEGSLGARAYSALALIVSLFGEPEKIDAAYISPAAGAALHALPGETLRALSGDLTACMRFADGRAAGLLASDHAGCWGRSVTLIGPAGRLRITDDGLLWIGPDGGTVDESTHAGGAARSIADSLSRILSADPGPTDHAAILSTAQAMLLSARTGESESPATIRRMIEQ
jgi:hypothetical protein